MPTPPAALSVAGSDPSGGAGIQADLKVFAAHGVYGMAAITALTVQNTTGVASVHPVPAAEVAAQVRAVREDIEPDAVKVGMLGAAGAVGAVADALADYPGPVVVDPVRVATRGGRLLPAEAEQALARLMSRATVITPNLPEARALLGEDPARWARRTGVAVLLTGGHGAGDPVEDRLFLPGGTEVAVRHPRVPTRNHHGTGCALSSALAARLARGEPLADAARAAVAYVAARLVASRDHRLGGGTGPLLHAPGLGATD